MKKQNLMEIISNSEVYSSIYKTTDYSLFGYITGNRQTSNTNIKRIIDSLKTKQIEEVAIIVGYDPNPVDGKHLKIIDGQHRFESCKKLNLPIYYVIRENFDINDLNKSLADVELLNTASETWDINNFMVSKATLGDENYIRYMKIKNKHNFEHEVIFYLLNLKDDRKKIGFAEFKNGELKLNEEDMYWLDSKLNFLSLFSDKIGEKGKRYYFKALTDVIMVEGVDVKRLTTKVLSENWEVPISKSKEYSLRIIQSRYNHKYTNKLMGLLDDGKKTKIFI